MTAMVVLDARLPMDDSEISDDLIDYRRISRLVVGTRLGRAKYAAAGPDMLENRAAMSLGQAYRVDAPAFIQPDERERARWA